VKLRAAARELVDDRLVHGGDDRVDIAAPRDRR
jgi:hypothetical protein